MSKCRVNPGHPLFTPCFCGWFPIPALLIFVCLMLPVHALAADDEGYFLSLRQKGQLIWDGRIQDEQGDWYDVWIVPGYVPPTRLAREGLRDTGAAFGEYFAAEKYRDLADDSGDAYRWAFKDVLYEFTLKGTPRAWEKHFSAARERTGRRVFGWWFAYPWAFFSSVADNVFRLPLGLAGTALGTAWGTAVVPTWHLSNSTLKGLWYASTEVVLVPVAGYAWNTAIAPPLSLLGQRPAPARVDGFWVRRLTNEELLLTLAADEPLRDEDFARLEQFARLLEETTGPYRIQMDAINAQADAAIRAANEQRQVQLAAARQEARQQVQVSLRQPQHGELTAYLRGEMAARLGRQLWRDGFRRHLAASGMSPEQIDRLVALVNTYVGDLQVEAPHMEKTDPLREIMTAPDKL